MCLFLAKINKTNADLESIEDKHCLRTDSTWVFFSVYWVQPTTLWSPKLQIFCFQLLLCEFVRAILEESFTFNPSGTKMLFKLLFTDSNRLSSIIRQASIQFHEIFTSNYSSQNWEINRFDLINNFCLLLNFPNVRRSSQHRLMVSLTAHNASKLVPLVFFRLKYKISEFPSNCKGAVCIKWGFLCANKLCGMFYGGHNVGHKYMLFHSIRIPRKSGCRIRYISMPYK